MLGVKIIPRCLICFSFLVAMPFANNSADESYLFLYEISKMLNLSKLKFILFEPDHFIALFKSN